MSLTAEAAKKHLAVITAFAEGKTIQLKCVDGWMDCLKSAGYSFSLEREYRIKPEEKWVIFDKKTNTVYRLTYGSKKAVELAIAGRNGLVPVRLDVSEEFS